jgi:hypothetical protein
MAGALLLLLIVLPLAVVGTVSSIFYMLYKALA